MRKLHAALPNTQRGATLVIALLILVMIMMYGIPAAMESLQNERMTGNTRQRDLAFQAAEHALKKAETWIFTKTAAQLNMLAPAAKCCPSTSSCTDTTDDADPVSGDGIFPNGECPPNTNNDIVPNTIDYWRNFDWNSKGINPTGSIDSDLVAAQPRYVVERMPNVTSGSPSVTKHYYRITARGVGKDSNAIVVLQTMYEYTN